MRRPSLIVIGAVLTLAAIVDRARVVLTQPEKDAVLAFGHWFDVAWEIDLPLFLAGAVALAFGLWRRTRL